MRTFRTRILFIMLVQQRHGRVHILQGKLVIFIHIGKICSIGIVRRSIQQVLISRISNYHYRISLLRHRRNRVMQARHHSHRKQQAKQYANYLTHSQRQTEIKTASLSQFTLHIEGTYPEEFIRFLIFLNDSLTVHQSETTAFIFFQFIRILRILNSDHPRIIYFLTNNTRHIFLRNTTSVIFHRNLHIRIRSTCVDLDSSSFRSIFTGILRQRIYHKQSQRPVCLHHNSSRFNLQRLFFHLKGTPSFSQQFKQFVKTERFDIQAQRSLLHLDPQSQNIVILINSSYQFINVLILLLLYLFIINISLLRKLVHLIQNTVDIRINTIHNSHTSLFYQILTLISRNMLLIDIPLFFQLHPFVAQCFHHLFIVRRPDNIRFKHMHQSLFITVQPMCGDKRRFPLFGNIQSHPILTKQIVYSFLNQQNIHWNGRSNIPAKPQNLLQTFHINLIPYLGTPVEEPPKNHYQHQSDNHQRKHKCHLPRTGFQ